MLSKIFVSVVNHFVVSLDFDGMTFASKISTWLIIHQRNKNISFAKSD